MTTQPTPETDKMQESDVHKIDEDSIQRSAYMRMTGLCRLMETERNEARAMIDKLKATLTRALEEIANQR